MCRRRGGAGPWAATSVPDLRRHWCNAIDATIQRHSEGLTPSDVDRPPAMAQRYERLQAKLAHAIEVMQIEVDALREAQLYWVSRDMVDLALGTAADLPAWTPARVAPAANGLLCWAKPASTVPCGPAKSATQDVTWDAVWWWSRPDGYLQLVPATRTDRNPELLEPYGVRSPLWAAHTIGIDAKAMRTEEANGAEDSHPFVSVVGAGPGY